MQDRPAGFRCCVRFPELCGESTCPVNRQTHPQFTAVPSHMLGKDSHFRTRWSVLWLVLFFTRIATITHGSLDVRRECSLVSGLPGTRWPVMPPVAPLSLQTNILACPKFSFVHEGHAGQSPLGPLGVLGVPGRLVMPPFPA